VRRFSLKDRNTIDKKYKWNLNDIYENYDIWESDLEKFEKLTKEVPKFKGEIKKSAKKFVELELLMEKISKLLDRLYLYPYMLKDLDSTDEMTSIKMQEIEMIYSKFATETAWISPEMLEIPEETMNEWIKQYPELEERKFGLSEMYRLRKHVLSEDKEELLSHFSQFMGSSSDIYAELSISDIKWNTVKFSTGEEIAVSNGVYSKILATNRNQEDRKLAFEALYKSYENSKNTFAAIYRAIVQRNVASCNARNYESSLDRALENKNIPREVYFSLVESAQENTAPLKRYVELRKKALKLKEYHYYDNSINIVDYDKVFKYDDAKEMVLKSVEPLGEDYQQKMKRAISEGWLDVFETKNKRSGAYSINIYDVHPYMLLNYQETMDDVFTLDYMLKNSNDSLEKIALLEQALGNIVGTYYIQTLFATYEYEAHKMIEEYKAITPDILSDIMFNLFKKYFGNTVTIDELQKIIWARIPHFYNSPFYVYQYATSFASSAKLYEDLKTNPENREKYLTLLKSGGNNHPMEQLKLAGVDLTKKESFDAVAKEFDRLLDILEDELKKINLI